MKVLELVRGVFGLIDLVAPRWLPGMLLGSMPDRKAAAVIRVLGLRQMLQAAFSYGGPRRVHRIGATVDILHAASMAGFAAVAPRHRKSALASAGVSVLLGIIELL